MFVHDDDDDDEGVDHSRYMMMMRVQTTLPTYRVSYQHELQLALLIDVVEVRPRDGFIDPAEVEPKHFVGF